jgi:hypothetical protein
MEDLKAHLFLLFLLSQKKDPREKQVINFDQDVHVCGIFLVDGLWTPFHDPSLSFIFFFFF